MERTHRYTLSLNWTGNTGTGTSGYTSYRRDHEIAAPRKAAPLALSSDPAFRGDPTRYSPEELLVASLSSCHMLWTLHLCADTGIVVTAYTDAPEGTMAEHADGSGEFTQVILHPNLTLADPTRAPDLAAIHHRAHELCFIARSMNFPVLVEPQP